MAGIHRSMNYEPIKADLRRKKEHVTHTTTEKIRDKTRNVPIVNIKDTGR